VASIHLSPVAAPDNTPPIKYRWQDDALCSQVSPEFFFPKKGGSTLDAKLLCVKCPVKMKCLQYAIAYEDDPEVDGYHGIFGGLSERERRALKKLRSEQPSISLETAYDAIVSSRKQQGNRKQNRPVAKAA
jgi:hypothetical protein